MLKMANASGLAISGTKRRNEEVARTAAEAQEGIARLWRVMSACIDRDLATDGVLPGGLDVARWAPTILGGLAVNLPECRL